MCITLGEHSSSENRQEMLVNIIEGMAEMYTDRNETPLSVQDLRGRIIEAFGESWTAGTEHRISGNASTDHIAQAACLLANHGQPNRMKETGLYVLIDRKYKSAEGTLKLLKKNRVI
jgi:hypothetical protein